MKFAHDFKDRLSSDEFPPSWVEAALPYGRLKKSIKKVQSELRSLGLDLTNVSQFVPTETVGSSSTNGLGDGDGDGSVPAISFLYDFDDGENPSSVRIVEKPLEL